MQKKHYTDNSKKSLYLSREILKLYLNLEVIIFLDPIAKHKIRENVFFSFKFYKMSKAKKQSKYFFRTMSKQIPQFNSKQFLPSPFS